LQATAGEIFAFQALFAKDEDSVAYMAASSDPDTVYFHQAMQVLHAARDIHVFVDKDESAKRSELCWSLLSAPPGVSVGLSGSLLQRRVRSPFDLMEEV